MPGGPFRPSIPAACAAALAALTGFPSAAFAGQGVTLARSGFGPGLGGTASVRPFAGPRIGAPNAPASFGPVLDAYRGSLRPVGRGGFGAGYGGFGERYGRGAYGSGGYGLSFLGLPWGSEQLGFGYPDGLGLAQPARPDRPSSLGIPPSPVQPPALYVIGQAQPAARVRRETRSYPSAGSRVVAGLAERAREPGAAAAPLFIRIPSGR